MSTPGWRYRLIPAAFLVLIVVLRVPATNQWPLLWWLIYCSVSAVFIVLLYLANSWRPLVAFSFGWLAFLATDFVLALVLSQSIASSGSSFSNWHVLFFSIVVRPAIAAAGFDWLALCGLTRAPDDDRDLSSDEFGAIDRYKRGLIQTSADGDDR